MEIGRKHETNLNSLKKLEKDEHPTVMNIANKERSQTRSRRKRSNIGTNKQDTGRERKTRQERQVREVWLRQDLQELSRNGTTEEFLQKDESLFQAL